MMAVYILRKDTRVVILAIITSRLITSDPKCVNNRNTRRWRLYN
jgi:hypothetical protein